MKKLTILFSTAFIFAAVMTQLSLLVCDSVGISVRHKPVPSMIYLCFMAVWGTFVLLKNRVPRMPTKRLYTQLRTRGYSGEFYSELFKWRDSCRKKGAAKNAELTVCEFLIDGGRYSEGFEALEKIDLYSLDRRQKQVYFNAWLYGAVLCSQNETAEKIYESAKPLLSSVKSKVLSASVKHTLGCFEYMRQNTARAEELFFQSLDNAKSDDLICEDWLAISVCYLDTGRYEQAKRAVETACCYACTLPLKQKVERAKSLVENEFRKIS